MLHVLLQLDTLLLEIVLKAVLLNCKLGHITLELLLLRTQLLLIFDHFVPFCDACLEEALPILLHLFHVVLRHVQIIALDESLTFFEVAQLDVVAFELEALQSLVLHH